MIEKENVQPSERDTEPLPNNSEEQPSSSTTNNQPIKRYVSRSDQSLLTYCFISRHSSKQHSGSSPSAKRSQRSSTDTPPPSSPPLPSADNPDFSSTKLPCKDFFDNKGYCALGDTCPYDHGSNVLSFEPSNYYPSYQPSIRQPLPAGQRTLVTVVTNAEPLPLEPRQRFNQSGGPMSRTRRHVTTTPYPNDRRMQDRARKRPCRLNILAMKNEFDHLGSKPDGSGSTTLEIRKIPVESNTISNLNEHFSKFGTVTNVQVYFHSFPV